LLWHHSTYCEGGGGKTPVLAGSTLYSRANVTGNLRLDAATGAEQGTFSSTTAPAFDGTRIFTSTSTITGTTLSAVDPSTQALLWSFAGDGSLNSAPLVVNGCVYEASGNGHLYALDASTGAVLDTRTLPAVVAAPDEQNVSQPLTGLGAGGGALLVPASTWLVAYTHS
jgi:outer membrane protein assembly factor BamB